MPRNMFFSESLAHCFGTKVSYFSEYSLQNAHLG